MNLQHHHSLLQNVMANKNKYYYKIGNISLRHH